MEIVPYQSVGQLMFGFNKDQCLAVLGKPNSIRFNRIGNEELEFPGIIVRLDPHNYQVCEFTLLPQAAGSIEGINITWDKEFLHKACKLDSNPLDIYGFIVLRKLGIAVTGIHDDESSQLAITVFREGAFDKLLSRSRPFSLSS